MSSSPCFSDPYTNSKRFVCATASPAGFAPDGQCLAQDVGGPSSYVRWLKTFVESQQARAHLTSRELQLLTRATGVARAHLQAHPHESKRLRRKRVDELDALLTSLVPPSNALFAQVFPDRLLCSQYKQKLNEEHRAISSMGLLETRRHMASEGKSAKYSVDWQRDDATEKCRLCGNKWTLLRRRHHCRACGQLVCDDCSRSRTHVPGSENLKRICDVCSAARGMHENGSHSHAHCTATTPHAAAARAADMV
jgi:hypothetical protein